MTTTVSAVYQGGVIRPSVPLPFADGTQVQVTVAAIPTDLPAPDPQQAAALIADMVARHAKPGPVEYTARDHDRYLYGEPRS